MRFIRILLVLLLVAIVGFYFIERADSTADTSTKNISNTVIKERDSLLKSKVVPKRPVITDGGEIFQWIGKNPEVLIEQLGEPVRKDKSAYNYTWWVYSNQKDQYLQFGVAEDEIITVYGIGEALDIKPIKIGQSRQEVKQAISKLQNDFDYSEEVSYTEGISSYSFQLKEEDVTKRPLIKLADDVFLQAYFDTFTDRLSSVRLLTGDVLLQHRPYAIEYRGDLPTESSFSREEWEEIETGMEKQIYDITNIIRTIHNKPKLKVEENVSTVAFTHSKDMAENNYFSHYSQDGSGLKERLAVESVYYTAAGENIAAQYPDAPSAMEGWLNSEGHREALLNDDYTHIGIGVYQFYYTQNFLERPE